MLEKDCYVCIKTVKKELLQHNLEKCHVDMLCIHGMIHHLIKQLKHNKQHV